MEERHHLVQERVGFVFLSYKDTVLYRRRVDLVFLSYKDAVLYRRG